MNSKNRNVALCLLEGRCARQPPGNDEIDSLGYFIATAMNTMDSRLWSPEFGLTSACASVAVTSQCPQQTKFLLLGTEEWALTHGIYSSARSLPHPHQLHETLLGSQTNPPWQAFQVHEP